MRIEGKPGTERKPGIERKPWNVSTAAGEARRAAAQRPPRPQRRQASAHRHRDNLPLRRGAGRGHVLPARRACGAVRASGRSRSKRGRGGPRRTRMLRGQRAHGRGRKAAASDGAPGGAQNDLRDEWRGNNPSGSPGVRSVHALAPLGSGELGCREADVTLSFHGARSDLMTLREAAAIAVIEADCAAAARAMARHQEEACTTRPLSEQPMWVFGKERGLLVRSVKARPSAPTLRRI